MSNRADVIMSVPWQCGRSGNFSQALLLPPEVPALPPKRDWACVRSLDATAPENDMSPRTDAVSTFDIVIFALMPA